jgi:hypothetical protein
MSRNSNSSETANWHAVIYRVLDGILSNTAAPAGARGAIFDVVDRLRSSSPNSREHCSAERISVEILNLESALQRSDYSAAKAARNELKALAADWLQNRITNANRRLADEAQFDRAASATG